MVSSSYIFSIVAASVVAFAALPSSTGQLFANPLDLIPEDLKARVPDPCQDGPDSEFPVAIGCAIGNIGECFGILSQLPTFYEIPTGENVTECEDIQEPFCQISTTCVPCIEEFDILVRCIVLNDPDIDVNTTELVDSCSLECYEESE